MQVPNGNDKQIYHLFEKVVVKLIIIIAMSYVNK